MKKTLFIVLLTTLCFANCKKSESSSGSCSVSKANLLGTYKLTDATYQLTSSSPVIDEYNTYIPCTNDDLYTFNSNGIIVITDAGLVCSPTSASTQQWSLNGTTLILDTDTFTVKSYDCKTLVIVTHYTPGENDTKYLTRQ